MQNNLFSNLVKKELIKIKNCDNTHKHCYEICNIGNLLLENVTQEYFNNLLLMMKMSNCINKYSNKLHIIKIFIINCSKFLIIPQWDLIINHFSDNEINEIINNQKKINYNFINCISEIFISYKKDNLLNFLISHLKIKSFENILMSMNINHFSLYIDKITKYNFLQIENIIIKYLDSNKNILKENKNISLKIIYTFIENTEIIKKIYNIISYSLTQTEKIDIFHKAISILNKKLILLLLENNNIIPDINTINELVKKNIKLVNGNYFNGYSYNNKLISDIIDILCEFGLIINKEIIILLLEHGYYINNIEKHNIKIDNEILAICSKNNYYPYKTNIEPNIEILINECSKNDNLNKIKEFKELGGKYNSICLEEACKIPKNGKVIKFLINDCDINVTQNCLNIFQDTYKIESLEILINKFKSQNLKETNTKSEIIEIDKDSTITIIPKQIDIDINDNTIEYKIKKKIVKFFNLKYNKLKYFDLYEIFLKYLISNKLVIGNYFIINKNLSELLKINNCTIINIDQLYNVLTYFFDL